MKTTDKTDTPRRQEATNSVSVAHQLYYYCIFLFVKTISYLPFKVLYLLSDLLYYPVYYLVRYRRKIVRKNLLESFPDKRLEEILGIEKKFYHFFVDMALESCKLLSMSTDEMKRRMRFVNMDLANQKLSQGKSVSLYLGHFGNWEWVSSMTLWLHKDAVKAQIYHQLRNKPMDRLMRVVRGRFGSISVDMYKTARFMSNASKDDKSYIIGFIADQSPKKREVRDFADFLNHSIPVLTGTEKLTKHYGYDALFLSMKRIKRGYYECELIPLHDHPQDLPNYELTQLYLQKLEAEIQQRPELYLWTHNRFKHAFLKK